eukprot:3745370-Prymnesium_polylepis.2
MSLDDGCIGLRVRIPLVYHPHGERDTPPPAGTQDERSDLASAALSERGFLSERGVAKRAGRRTACVAARARVVATGCARGARGGRTRAAPLATSHRVVDRVHRHAAHLPHARGECGRAWAASGECG